MRTPGRGWIAAVFCLSNFCLLNIVGLNLAAAQPSDQVVAERVLGAQWKQLARRAGMIFAGTVLGSTPPTTTIDRAVPASIPAVQLSFRVDRAIAGVERGQVLTIHEWAAGSMHRPMRKGQHILIFLYPPSRLGLTSPVGGSLGQVALDASGKNVSRAGFAHAPQPGGHVPQGLKPAVLQGLNGTAEALHPSKPKAGLLGTPVVPYPKPGTGSVIQLERAIRSARSEQE